MNGVRRFLGGGITQTTPSPSPPPTLTSIQTTAPPPVPGKTNWPPTSPTTSSSPVSPRTTTAGLFFRKDEAQKPQPAAPPRGADEDDGRWRPLRPAVNQSPSTSPAQKQTSLPSSPIRKTPSPAFSGGGRSSPAPILRTNPTRSNELPRKAVTQANANWRNTSGLLNTKDEMLMSLLTSEAVVDSREFQILSAEEVEELKKEQQILSARLGAMTKKLALETKIRDAALSLSRVNATHKAVSKQSSEQLDNANRKVEAAQKELWRVSERSNEILRKLNEHRAGVLSFSVRSLESQLAPAPVAIKSDTDESGYSTSAQSSDANASPTSSATSVSVVSKASRFDGAHLFAGHAGAVQPRKPLSAAEVAVLEEKLRAATESLGEASRRQATMARELSHLRLEKEEAQTMMEFELQGATERIAGLEDELDHVEGLEKEVSRLRDERSVWERDKKELAERERQIETLERRLEVMEERSGEATGMEALLSQAREETREVRAGWNSERTAWERERASSKPAEDYARLQDELRLISIQMSAGQDALRTLVRAHNIDSQGDSSLPALVTAIGSHLASSRGQAQDEWDILRRKLEEDLRKGLDRREQLANELEEARREREEARGDVRMLEKRLKDQSDRLSGLSSARSPASETSSDSSKIIAILQPLWAIIPSPEARAAKFGAKSPRVPQSPTMAPVSPNTLATSISELDVRSLKALYDPNTSVSFASSGTFSIENFATRVHALIADDRALIERLLRFAQAHDLLKKNAERAQKLAQESNQALETYQKQVKALETRSMTAIARQTELHDQVHQLEETVERIQAEKQEVEIQAAAQAETCRQLTDANNALSAKTLTLAEEAAAAPLVVRKQMEAQLTECKAALERAEDEIEAMRSSEQSQRIALLDELNSMQTENGNLRAQLRAAKK